MYLIGFVTLFCWMKLFEHLRLTQSFAVMFFVVVGMTKKVAAGRERLARGTDRALAVWFLTVPCPHTPTAARLQIASFVVILLVFLLAFTSLDFIAFGATRARSKTFVDSLISRFQGSLGDVDFESAREVDPFWGEVSMHARLLNHHHHPTPPGI
jgi:hypothetical protein